MGAGETLTPHGAVDVRVVDVPHGLDINSVGPSPRRDAAADAPIEQSQHLRTRSLRGRGYQAATRGFLPPALDDG